jgi:hypothetical protein
MAEQTSDPPERPRCSARGCRTAAEMELRWRNPSVHVAGRVKVWTACADHTASLADFLERRGFLLDQVPLT